MNEKIDAAIFIVMIILLLFVPTSVVLGVAYSRNKQDASESDSKVNNLKLATIVIGSFTGILILTLIGLMVKLVNDKPRTNAKKIS